MLLNNIYKRRTPDILECIANLSSDEVFTPPQVANDILDLLPEEVWSNKDLKFLDPACKTGIFLRECAKRLMVGLEKIIPDEDKRREHIFKNMLYGIAITDITSLMSRRSLYYSKSGLSPHSVIKFDKTEGNILYKNIEHSFEGNVRKCVYCGAPAELLDRVEGMERHAYQFIHEDINKIFNNMKFDVIIGNPPYQLNDGGGTGSSAMPIYHKFIEVAIALNPKYISMIIPSRWFAGGKGLDDFRSKMLSDRRLKTLVDHPNAGDCFPGVSIEGGVCYFLWDDKYQGDCEIITNINNEEISRAKRKLDDHDIFIRRNESISILEKVKNRKEEILSKKVFSRNPFSINDINGLKNKKFNNSVKIYYRGGSGWINNSNINENKNLINKYKVLLGKAYGGGSYPNNIFAQPILGEKKSCCTETYLLISYFDKKEMAENLIKYMKTRFFRFLVSLRKNTQNMSKSIFSFIPDLDMSQEWTDEKLYKRYDIDEKEQEFIKSIVKEMA